MYGVPRKTNTRFMNEMVKIPGSVGRYIYHMIGHIYHMIEVSIGYLENVLVEHAINIF